MAFMKVKIKQQAEGQPGFMESELFEIQIDAAKITLFNRSEDDPDITFVRLMCGATLCIDTPYSKFVAKLQAALKSDPTKVMK